MTAAALLREAAQALPKGQTPPGAAVRTKVRA